MKNRNIATLVFFALLWVSCDKTLELQPTESLSTQEALADLPSMRTALHGAYNTLQSPDYYGHEFIVLPEILANLVYLRFPHNFLLEPFYTYSMTPLFSASGVWNACYKVILKANNIINNIDQVDGDTEEKNQIKGEALAIRALAYFDLVRFFARQYTSGNPVNNLGVPIVLEAGIYQPPRNTVEEVYNQVITDLEAASLLLGNVGPYRFSGDAADALLARVSLYKGDWAKAQQLSTALIESGRYSLEDDVVALFAAPGSSEEIFTLKFEISEDLGITGVLGIHNLGANYHPSGLWDIGVSLDLVNLYEPDDTRFVLVDTIEGEYFQTKYLGQSGVAGLHSPKLLRLAEMYLVCAEARYRQNDIEGALEDLNTLRFKRGATEWTSLPSVDGIDVILAERHRELAFEGHTVFDYWRTGTPMVRDTCYSPDPCEVPASSYLAVQPIPQSEMDANMNMVQNEGY